MNKTDYNDLSVFKKNVEMMDTLINQLYSFLNDGSTVQIKNSDFMQCHGYFIQHFITKDSHSMVLHKMIK
jgi:hypothetical protein